MNGLKVLQAPTINRPLLGGLQNRLRDQRDLSKMARIYQAYDK